MNTLLAIAIMSLAAFAQAIGFSSGSSVVTQNEPTKLSVTTNTVGDLHVYARFEGKGAILTVRGVASCASTSGRFKEVFCTVYAAPPGTYEIVVQPKSNYSIQNVNGSVTGELVIGIP